MLFSNLRPVIWTAALLAALVSGSPTPVDVMVAKPQHDLAFREALELAHHPQLEKRLSADFDMSRSWKNQVLFNGSYTTKDAIGITDKLALAVTCVECYTKGTVTAKLTDEHIIDPAVRLEFKGVEAYVDMRVAMSAGATYSVNLFTSNSPIGLGFPGLSVGVVFYVDLVFSLTEEIDLEGGFYVKVADSAYLEASIFGGDITDSFFDGLSSKSLPITVFTGKATFKADLRLRVQCGAEGELPGIGFGAGAELGIYANLIEFVAVLETTPDCALQSREWWDLNVGAFAHFDVVVDYTTIGAIPTISTTLLSAPTATQCWIQKGGAGGGGSGGYTSTFIGTTPIGISSGAPTTSTSLSTPSRSATISRGGSPSESPSGAASISTSGTAAVSTSKSPGTISATASYNRTNSSSPATTSLPATSSPAGDEIVTSTVYTTSTYTITACAASVVNCPASYQSQIVVTQTIDLYTTVCPASATLTPPAPSDVVVAQDTTTVIVDLITDIVVLVPCATPIIETFVPPTNTAVDAYPSVSVAIGVKIITTAEAHASSTPYGGKGYHNGTVSSSTRAAHGTGKPSASLVQTTTAAAIKPTIATAGAGRVMGSGVLALVGACGLWMLL